MRCTGTRLEESRFRLVKGYPQYKMSFIQQRKNRVRNKFQKEDNEVEKDSFKISRKFQVEFSFKRYLSSTYGSIIR